MTTSESTSDAVSDAVSETPIFDELHAARAGEKPAPYRHASGEPCHGCQSCLADAVDDHDAGEFYEDDEPVDHVVAAFAAGEQGTTGPPADG